MLIMVQNVTGVGGISECSVIRHSRQYTRQLADLNEYRKGAHMTDPSKTTHTATGEQEGQQAGLPVADNAKRQGGQFANLTIKVQKRQRLHWLIEAKKQGTSLTAAITDALNQRFGTPE